MIILDSATVARILGTVCILALPFIGSPVLGDGWSDDIEFASCECGAPNGNCCSCDCPSGCCTANAGCSNCGYCFSSPMSDELTRRMTAMAKSMEASGFVYAPSVSQFYQGVTEGGFEQEFEYGGKVDQFLILDSGKLGLWQGMTMTMHAETRFGEDVNFDAVGFAPANVAMLYPKFNEHDTAITGLTFSQYVTEEWQTAFGKYNALDLFYALYPQTGRGVNGFMNASMVVPIGVARVVPLSFMGVGVTKYVEKKPVFGLTVFDNQNVTTTSGFDDMFQNGANILAFYRYYTNVGGLPGSHMFGGIWATGEYASFDPLSFVILPAEGIVVERDRGAYTLLYIFEQTVWADRCNKERNIGILSQWGLADKRTSPFSWSCNVAIQATGLNRNRPADSIGVGYFHTGLSDDFINSLSPAFDLQDVDGVELYYNAAIAKCFQLTADLQVIEPAEEQLNTAIVFGLRGTIGI